MWWRTTRRATDVRSRGRSPPPTCAATRSRNSSCTRSRPRPPTTRAATRRRSRSSTSRPRPGAWRTWRRAATWSCGPRAIRCSAAVTCMSIIVGRGAEAAGQPLPGERATRGGSATGRGTGRVDVVGLGPAGRDWLTPEAMAVLAAADDLVGYAPYVDRVARNPRQQRHSSDNTEEAQRAEFALDLALRGRRVAVVSSGDPGVFAMASVVLEAAAGHARFADVPVHVVPGITAAQAVASQAGAPLGHAYVVLSLSDP